MTDTSEQQSKIDKVLKYLDTAANADPRSPEWVTAQIALKKIGERAGHLLAAARSQEGAPAPAPKPLPVPPPRPGTAAQGPSPAPAYRPSPAPAPAPKPLPAPPPKPAVQPQQPAPAAQDTPPAPAPKPEPQPQQPPAAVEETPPAPAPKRRMPAPPKPAVRKPPAAVATKPAPPKPAVKKQPVAVLAKAAPAVKKQPAAVAQQPPPMSAARKAQLAAAVQGPIRKPPQTPAQKPAAQKPAAQKPAAPKKEQVVQLSDIVRAEREQLQPKKPPAVKVTRSVPESKLKIKGGKIEYKLGVEIAAGVGLETEGKVNLNQAARSIGSEVQDVLWKLSPNAKDMIDDTAEIAKAKAKLITALKEYAAEKKAKLLSGKAEHYVNLDAVQAQVDKYFPRRLLKGKGVDPSLCDAAITEAITECVEHKPGQELEFTVAAGVVSQIRNMADFKPPRPTAPPPKQKPIPPPKPARSPQPATTAQKQAPKPLPVPPLKQN